MTKATSLLAFILLWAKLRGWAVPALHVRMVDWLSQRRQVAAAGGSEVSVLLVFRGAAKSTFVALYEAFTLYERQGYRFLNQAADDATASKLSRDVRNVLWRHPLCQREGLYVPSSREHQKAVRAFSVVGHDDPRNPSVASHGILSNVTSSRADEVVNDDVEVPKNIRGAPAREQLNLRLDEQTHIMVPGALQLFVGTPHTFDSLYDRLIADGANVLKIPLFEHHVRYSDPAQRRLPFNFQPAADGLYVFHGMKLLTEGRDYQLQGQVVVLPEMPLGTVDIYAGCAWPERFDRRDIAQRRKKCKTLNTWDSQYMLIARPLHEIRLDPDKLIPYEAQPLIRFANQRVAMFLGQVQIVGAAAYWDVATGKPEACDSALSLALTDASGNLYLQESVEFEGDVFDPDHPTTKGQCARVRELVIRYQLPNVHVEVNGPGTFVPPLLRRALAGTGCGVIESVRSGNKHEYILDALETPLSSQILWAHVDVCAGKLAQQMRDYIPGSSGQLIDHLDAAAGAVKQTPIRIGKVIGAQPQLERQAWRPDSGDTEVQFEVG